MKTYYVYIMASYNEVLYVGMTNNLLRRIYEHKHELIDGFTKKYKCHNLIYYESSNDVNVILEREKQLKRWSRAKKLALIKEANPELKDFSADFIESK
ncbi:MAG: GIY-YIG nuclease family protein [bacterium]